MRCEYPRSVRPIWTGNPPLPSTYIEYTGTALEGVDGLQDATIAETLAALPSIARMLEFRRKRLGLPGPDFVSPHAIIGDDVYLGPGCRVYEFSTVRDGSVIDEGALVGYGNEVVRSYVGPESLVSHDNTVSFSLLGRGVDLTAGVRIGSMVFGNANPRRPNIPIHILMPNGSVYDTGIPKFGAIIGDETCVGMNAVLGPGVILSSGSVIGGLARVLSGLYPGGMHIKETRSGTVLPPTYGRTQTRRPFYA